MDKIRFQAERGEGIRSGSVCVCVCARVWVQLGSHLLSSSGAWNDSRGKQTGKGDGGRGRGCVRGGGGEERQEMRINTEPGMLGNGIFKGVSGGLLKVEPYQQGFLS